MSLGLSLNRPLIAQVGRTFSFAVTATAQPLIPNFNKSQLITTFIVSNPIAGVSVYIGFDSGVTTTTGLEILAGSAPVFRVNNTTRQLYELQAPILELVGGVNCRNLQAEAVPFAVWDMSSVFVVAGGNTTISVGLFPEMYI